MVTREFPEGMEPLGKDLFQFHCHDGVACFTSCCKKVDIVLFPYDIIRLKQCLQIDSETFMRQYTHLVKGDNPFFPTVMLKLNDDEENQCPFLSDQGCRVYPDRPSACRTYPVERAVSRDSSKGRPEEYYFLTRHSYCQGHYEENYFSVKDWVRNQKIDQYNMMNDLWTDLDTIFRQNPWKGEGSGGPRQQMAFMVCYNIDGFRHYVIEQNLLKKFKLTKDQKKRIGRDDVELQKFGFEWLKLFLTGKSSLIVR